MNDTVSEVLARLNEHGIRYELIEHEPLSSMEECKKSEAHFGAVMPKNLFLTTRRQGGLYLFVTRPDIPFSAGVVSRQAGTSRLCFAGDEALYENLRTRPGSISPLGLMFDREKKVRLLLDKALKEEEKLIFHPCDNRYSLCMQTEDFLNTFLKSLSVEPLYIDPMLSPT